MKKLRFLSVFVILVLLLTACGQAPPEQTTANEPKQVMPTEKPNNQGVNLPPMPQPDKGNPKLDSFLNQLIDAEKRGEAESFSRQRNTELVDGKVRVQIEAELGQLDAAAKAAAAVGTVELIVKDFNHVQAVVPITSLTALANEESIRFIGNPIKSTPTTGN